MQTLDAKVLVGREAVAPLKCGSERSFRYAGLSSQFRNGQRLIGTPDCQFRRGLREATPTIEVTTCGMLAAREEILSRRQQFMPAGVHGNRTVQQLWLRLGHRQDMVHPRRESSLPVRWRLQQLHSLGSRDKPVQNADGSTDLYPGAESPGRPRCPEKGTSPFCGSTGRPNRRLRGPGNLGTSRRWVDGSRSIRSAGCSLGAGQLATVQCPDLPCA